LERSYRKIHGKSWRTSSSESGSSIFAAEEGWFEDMSYAAGAGARSLQVAIPKEALAARAGGCIDVARRLEAHQALRAGFNLVY
jgi:hypothetical protein